MPVRRGEEECEGWTAANRLFFFLPLAVSASNVRSLTKENSSWLLLPISEFCEKLNLQQGNYCRTTTTLVDAVQQIKKHSLHRLFVVDEAGVLVTVLTVGDVLRHLFDVAR